MKLVRKSETIKIKEEGFQALEYNFKDVKALNACEVTLNCRYPEKGWIINKEIKEVAYVLSGGGKIVVKGEERDLQIGDAIYLDKEEPYYWIGENLKMLLVCNPAFYPEQHAIVD